MFHDPNYPEEPFREKVRKEEMYKLCGEFLNRCTVQKIRHPAMDVLSVLYRNDGMIKRAQEICRKFPTSYYNISDECPRNSFTFGRIERNTKPISKNICNCIEFLISKTRKFGTFVAKTND